MLKQDKKLTEYQIFTLLFPFIVTLPSLLEVTVFLFKVRHG
jgi:hypothetical protein